VKLSHLRAPPFEIAFKFQLRGEKSRQKLSPDKVNRKAERNREPGASGRRGTNGTTEFAKQNFDKED
jgi:hypothetical protein